MRALPTKYKPILGFSHFLHIALLLLLPVLLYVLVRVDFVQIAIGLVLISKWRMFAVRPRYWIANLRSNASDIFVGLSIVVFMTHTDVASWQIFWAAFYAIWLVYIKPGSNHVLTWAQAVIGQTMALIALFMAWKDVPVLGLIVAVWAICYATARHFFTSYDESHSTLYAYAWAYFAAGMMWVLGHWLIFFGLVPQIALLLSVIALGFSALYYLEESERLSVLWRRQFMFIMAAIIVIILVFSSWEIA